MRKKTELNRNYRLPDRKVEWDDTDLVGTTLGSVYRRNTWVHHDTAHQGTQTAPGPRCELLRYTWNDPLLLYKRRAPSEVASWSYHSGWMIGWWSAISVASGWVAVTGLALRRRQTTFLCDDRSIRKMCCDKPASEHQRSAESVFDSLISTRLEFQQLVSMYASLVFQRLVSLAFARSR